MLAQMQSRLEASGAAEEQNKDLKGVMELLGGTAQPDAIPCDCLLMTVRRACVKLLVLLASGLRRTGHGLVGSATPHHWATREGRRVRVL